MKGWDGDSPSEGNVRKGHTHKGPRSPRLPTRTSLFLSLSSGYDHHPGSPSINDPQPVSGFLTLFYPSFDTHFFHLYRSPPLIRPDLSEYYESPTRLITARHAPSAEPTRLLPPASVPSG